MWRVGGKGRGTPPPHLFLHTVFHEIELRQHEQKNKRWTRVKAHIVVLPSAAASRQAKTCTMSKRWLWKCFLEIFYKRGKESSKKKVSICTDPKNGGGGGEAE
jgi:hypothetical protein